MPRSKPRTPTTTFHFDEPGSEYELVVYDDSDQVVRRFPDVWGLRVELLDGEANRFVLENVRTFTGRATKYILHVWGKENFDRTSDAAVQLVKLGGPKELKAQAKVTARAAAGGHMLPPYKPAPKLTKPVAPKTGFQVGMPAAPASPPVPAGVTLNYNYDFTDLSCQYRLVFQRPGQVTDRIDDVWGLQVSLIGDADNTVSVEVDQGLGSAFGSLTKLTLRVTGMDNLKLIEEAIGDLVKRGGPDAVRQAAQDQANQAHAAAAAKQRGPFGNGRNRPGPPPPFSNVVPPPTGPSTPNPAPPSPLPNQGGSTTVPASKTVTCQECPALVSPRDHAKQRELFGAPTGLSMCGRYGWPLSTRHSDGEQIETIMKRSAELCKESDADWNGKLVDQPDPADREAMMFRFAVPTAEARSLAPELDIDNPEAFVPGAEACPGCTKYIRPEVMQGTFGIPLAGCAARGALLPSGQGQVNASGCRFNIAGAPITNPSQLTLTARLGGNVNVIDFDSGEPTVPTTIVAPDEPTTITTDKEVTLDDEAKGIRAWVKLTDPSGSGNHVFMPVFDRKHFTPEEAAKIPQTGEDAHPELYQDHLGLLYRVVVIWMHMNETPALNGVAGTGKTDFFRYVAWRMQLPFERVSITDGTELDDLAGRTVFENQQTTFQYGRIPKAWGKECVIVIDEPNVGPQAVWQFLRPLTDNAKQLVLDMNKGERIDRNEFCFMGMAFNPSWDMRNDGTHEISDADGRRLMHIAVPTPTKEVERDILTRRCLADGYKIKPPVLKSIMGISEDLRALAKNETIPIQWGTAQNIKVARASQWFSLQDCYRMAAADLLEPSACEQILNTVKNHVEGSGSKRKKNSPFGD